MEKYYQTFQNRRKCLNYLIVRLSVYLGASQLDTQSTRHGYFSMSS